MSTDDDDVDDDGDVNRIPAATARAVLDYLVKAVVDDPDAVEVDVVDRRGRSLIECTSRPATWAGSSASGAASRKSIRTVVRAAAVRDGVEVDVDFVD